MEKKPARRPRQQLTQDFIPWPKLDQGTTRAEKMTGQTRNNSGYALGEDYFTRTCKFLGEMQGPKGRIKGKYTNSKPRD